MDGVINREDKDGVELDLGYGTTTFSRSEIDHIERSDAEGTQKIWQTWGEEQKDIQNRIPEEQQKWSRRQQEIERLRKEQEQAKRDKDEYSPKELQVVSKNGSMLVKVLINEKTAATLVFDSGANDVVLTRRVAQMLGVDPDNLPKQTVQVADGRMVSQGSMVLESVKLINAGPEPDAGKASVIEVKNVKAGVVLDEQQKGGLEDGLLGMSFLKNFKFNADYKSSKITFEKLKDVNASEQS